MRRIAVISVYTRRYERFVWRGVCNASVRSGVYVFCVRVVCVDPDVSHLRRPVFTRSAKRVHCGVSRACDAHRVVCVAIVRDVCVRAQRAP